LKIPPGEERFNFPEKNRAEDPYEETAIKTDSSTGSIHSMELKDCQGRKELHVKLRILLNILGSCEIALRSSRPTGARG